VTSRLSEAPEADLSHNSSHISVDVDPGRSSAMEQRVDHDPTHTSDCSTHEHEHEEEESFHPFSKHTFQFLLAGGIAGVVSRTATAPFDRLRVYLMTAAPEQLVSAGAPVKEAIMALRNGGTEAGVAAAASTAQQGSRIVGRAVASLYRGGGIRAFWVGNGLNTTKILPVRLATSRLTANHLNYLI
jgi:solute carrier family 25 phosphate transporter 23/24/25/41